MAGWLFCLPEWPPCPVHGHGVWWERRGVGDLHCVGCWPSPPPRAIVRNRWETLDGAELEWLGFRAGDTVVFCKTDGDWRWPWPDTDQPPEDAF